MRPDFKPVAGLGFVVLSGTMSPSSPAQTIFSDSFNTNTNTNYLTNGVAGTIWDGVYFGADDYITNFVWGGLRRATNGTYACAIDGVPDWHMLRTNGNLSIGCGCDYPGAANGGGCGGGFEHRFAAAQAMVLQEDLSRVSFRIESENTAAHSVTVHLAVPATAADSATSVHGVVAVLNLQAGQETTVTLPMDAAVSPQPFGLTQN